MAGSYRAKKVFGLPFFLSFIIALTAWSASSAAAEGTGVIRGNVTLKTAQGEIKKDASGVVIYLENEALSKSPAVPTATRPAIHQRNKEFVPAVLPVLVGTTVDFPNDDNVFHNAFSVSKTKPFDLGVYKQETTRSVTFDVPGPVKVYCNIHAHMVGFVLVLSNPFFCMSDADGRFEIKDVPSGTYTVRAWQRYGEGSESQVTVAPEQTQDIRFEMLEENRVMTHKNKLGEDYDSSKTEGQY